MKFEVMMGIGKPEKDPAGNLSEMRQAIERAQRDSGLVANCLGQSRYQGLSGEDTYTLLAYHSLRMLEDIWQRYMKMASCTPAPPITMPASTVGGERE